MIPTPRGQHLLIDFHAVAPELLSDEAHLGRCLNDAARLGRLTPLGPPVFHRFEGGGLTGFLVLSESHLAIHTYPEHGYAALDLFACGDYDPDAALDALRAGLAPGRERVTTAARGEAIEPHRAENL